MAALGINMTQAQQRNFILGGAIGALVAFISLIAMALLPRPFSPMDHESILTGLNTLSTEQLSAYKTYIMRNLTWDSFYLIGHALMWFGYSAVISRSSKGLAIFVAILGFSSAWLDFTENEMRWAALQLLINNGYISISNIADWSVIFGLSFWIIFICGLVCGMAVAGKENIKKIVCIIAILGGVIAPFSYLYGHLAAFLWLIVWHGVSAIFLWVSRESQNA